MEKMIRMGILAGVMSTLCGCNTEISPDAGQRNPQNYNTREGALLMYNNAIANFQGGVVQAAMVGGMMTDELQTRQLGNPYFGIANPSPPSYLDARMLVESRLVEGGAQNEIRGIYIALNTMRATASQAIGALATYGADLSPALQAEMYAVRGYAELMLADVFCTGIPLSTYDFGEDFTYRPGSSTEQVYEQAQAAFDTAIQLSGDNVRTRNLARIGKARVLLARKRYPEARQVAQDVEDGFVYQFTTEWRIGTRESDFFGTSVSDVEGGNGFPYRSSGDPRTVVRYLGLSPFGIPLYAPDKYYHPTGKRPFVVASGIEARLIVAEAELNADTPGWLAILNGLRTDGTFALIPNPDVPGGQDTVWNRGTGGVHGLRPLLDPGNAVARIDLLFRERAYWLFVTGHRQGDLRRLIRQYGREADQVYPTGLYADGIRPYGKDVALPIPSEEHNRNPLYRGCINRGA